MVTKFKRILSLLLATVLCVSCIAFPAVAEETEPAEATFPITKATVRMGLISLEKVRRSSWT